MAHETLIDSLKTLPDAPGVYLMKNRDGAVIYVGKALSLRKRVGSYFARTAVNPKTQVLVSHISTIDTVRTSSEAEALLLEAALIKEYQPRYNIAIKDDKAYPLLRLSVQEPYPRLSMVRRVRQDGARYFGPYPSVKLLKQALIWLRRQFPLRRCSGRGESSCLFYHLGQCPGPHNGKVDTAVYRKTVEHLLLFLEGKKRRVISQLTQEMETAAAALDFERAAELRDQISGLGNISGQRSRFRRQEQLKELQAYCGLSILPQSIEGYDISNLNGQEAVGAMVRFEDAQPVKSRYRRFRIRGVVGIDDYAMMREMVRRRFSGEVDRQFPRPDLLLIDGGKGHLQAAVSALAEMNVTVPVISIAKQQEQVFVPQQSQPLPIGRDSGSLYLLQRIRDEAHRFAVTYHRALYQRKMLLSALDQIPGVGPKRRVALQQAFAQWPAKKKLTLEQLTAIKGIDRRTAENLLSYLQSNSASGRNAHRRSRRGSFPSEIPE